MAEIDDLVRRIVREELAKAAPPPTPLRLQHGMWGIGSRRLEAKLARTGAIEAIRIGRSWLATRDAIDRYVAEHGVRPAPKDERRADEDDLVAATRAAGRRMGGRRG